MFFLTEIYRIVTEGCKKQKSQKMAPYLAMPIFTDRKSVV